MTGPSRRSRPARGRGRRCQCGHRRGCRSPGRRSRVPRAGRGDRRTARRPPHTTARARRRCWSRTIRINWAATSVGCGRATAIQGAAAVRAAGSSNRAWKPANSSSATAAASAVTLHSPSENAHPAGSEVLEEDGEVAVIGRGREICVGHPQVEGPGDVGVEAGLPLAHAAGADHLPVDRVERCQLHEQRRRPLIWRRIAQGDPHPLVGGDRMIQDLHVHDLSAENLREPRRGQFLCIDWKRAHWADLSTRGPSLHVAVFDHRQQLLPPHAPRGQL